MPELSAISLLHFKVITLTRPHCPAINLENNFFIRYEMVGSERFEHSTSASQTQNHTKLDHDPSMPQKLPNLSLTDIRLTKIHT